MPQIEGAKPVPALPGQTVTLQQYQTDGARMMKSFKDRVLLADEMGLGKTVQVLYRMAKWQVLDPDGIFVVVAPACAKYVWRNQAKDHFGLRTYVCMGRKPKEVSRRERIFIVNYDILAGWIPYFKKRGVKMVTMDEVHYIKNLESARTKACHLLCEEVPKVFAVSGTPATNRPFELFSALHILWPHEFKSPLTFGMEYTHASRERGRWVFKGAQNLDKLHARLREIGMIRRRKKDVLTQLPAKQRFIVEMPVEDEAEYKEASRNFMFWLRSTKPSSAKGAERNEALVKLGYMLRLASKMKYKAVCEWIDNFLEESDGKLVVFTGRKKLIQALEARYGDRAVKVDGDVPVPKRTILAKAFNTEPKLRIFLGNYQAAGVSIDLTAAEDLFCCDLPWSPGDLVQAEDRIHRLTQRGNARIYLSVATGTIEVTQARILTEKMKVLTAIFDGEGSGDQLDVFADLIDGLNEKKN